MRKAIFGALMFAMLSTSSANAATSTANASNWTTNTRANDWSIAASGFGMGISSATGLALDVSPQIEYFVRDQISVGGTLAFNSMIGTFSSANFALGPSATWHFWTEEKLSAYGGTSLIFSNLSQLGGNGIGTSLNLNGGVNYNFAPWFGVGPRVNYTLIGNGVASNALTANLNLYFYL